MAVQVISNEQNRVTVESDIEATDKGGFVAAIEELRSPDTRKMVAAYLAEKNIVISGFGTMNHPYPVDPAGKDVTDYVKQQLWRYRVDIPYSPRIM